MSRRCGCTTLAASPRASSSPARPAPSTCNFLLVLALRWSSSPPIRPRARGYLTLYAADTPLPATNIDWSETGEVIATSSTVNVDDEGRISITAGHDATHFIVGVTGYVM
jgi:hypothetical protein